MAMLLRDKLTRVRFQGAKEYRLVFDDRIAHGQAQPDAWQGLGGLVYLADTAVEPQGQMQRHEQHGIDVITLLLKGRISDPKAHENGEPLTAWQVVVQRADGESFSYQANNPDDTDNRIIQLWMLPEQIGAPATCELLKPEVGRVTRVYGGVANRTGTLSAHTCIDIARLQSGQSLDIDKPSLVYICEGRCFANEDTVSAGVLLRNDQLTIDAAEDTCLVIIHEEGP